MKIIGPYRFKALSFFGLLALLLGGATSAAQQAPALPGAQPISSRDRVYTADQASNTVTVIDPSQNRVFGTIAIGKQRLDGLLGPQYKGEVGAHGLGFSRDGSLLSVINVTTNSAIVVETAHNQARPPVYLGRAPHEGFISPDGAELWTAIRGQDYVSIVDLAKNAEVARVRTASRPSKVLFDPAGTFAYVNHLEAAEIDVIDVKARTVVARIGGLADVFSSDMAISPDGAELWAAHKKSGNLSVVDLARRAVSAVLDTGPDTNHPNFVTLSDASYAVVTVGGASETLVYRRGAKPVLVKRIANTGAGPHGIWPSPDNTRVYVAMEDADSVDVIDTASWSVIATMPVGQNPQALVYVAGAVPAGDGLEHLGRQGLGLHVQKRDAEVPEGSGVHVSVTVRQVAGTDQIQATAGKLAPNSKWTLFGVRDEGNVPLGDFTADQRGDADLLLFTRFFGVYEGTVAAPAK